MTVLSDTEIIRRLDLGQIVMYPRNDNNVRGSSVDLTLGRNFFRCRGTAPPGESPMPRVLNPFDPADVGQYFAGPMMLKPYDAVADKINLPQPRSFEGIPETWPVLVLRPRERILAHTHEFFGTHPPGTCEMRARSTWGRLGLAVCLCAGWGDPGYINRWTMEIHNTNDCHVIIPFGERVCQMVLHESFEAREHYGTEQLYASKYQTAGTIREVITNWSPTDMLPRAYKDRRVVPTTVRAEEGWA